MKAEQRDRARRARCGRNFRLAALAGAALAVASAHAQDSSSQGNQSKKGDGELEEIIVTANKREENLQSIGAGISVVSDARLDQLQANSLADYLQEIPGVNLQSYGAPGWGEIEIRGISPQSVGATVSTYIDNIPVGGSSAVAEGGSYVPDLDPATICSALMGPERPARHSLWRLFPGRRHQLRHQAAELDRDRSEDISEEFEHVDHGDYGGKVRASFSTPLTDELAVRVSGYYRYIPGYIDDVGLGGPNANHGYDWGIRGTALWKPRRATSR